MQPKAAVAAAREAVGPVAVAVGAVSLAGAPTLSSMAEIWERSETYQHGWLVAPIALWLIWRKRAELAQLPLQTFWPAMFALALAGFIWLLGRLAVAAVVEQFAWVAMLQAAVLTVVGPAVGRAIAFPLAFLVFAVPFGEALVPTLIDWTADFTVAALKLTGIPVYREGNHFVIPSGHWSVVEACSGLRYLIACLMAGTLYAYLMYCRLGRRLAFIAVSVIVPIIANWLRAYLIVLVGHLSDNRLAAGIDHLIYGWIFFGVIIGVLFWAGARFREADGDVGIVAGRTQVPSASARRLWSAAVAVTLLVSFWPAAATALSSMGVGASALPALVAPSGWHAASVEHPWRPRFTSPASELYQAFDSDQGRVHLYIAYYGGSGKGAIGGGHNLVAPEDKYWRLLGEGRLRLQWAGSELVARHARLAAESTRIDAVWWYWVDGHSTASAVQAKAWQALSRLIGRGGHSAAVFLFVDVAEGETAALLLQRFAQDFGFAVNQALAAVHGEAATR